MAEITQAEAANLLGFVQRFAECARPLVQSLKDVGDSTNWADGEETDRVYTWYEIDPLAETLFLAEAALRQFPSLERTLTNG